MARELIYKDEAYSAVLHDNPQSAYCISRIKPVDAVEVVHGRWLYDSGSGRYFCPACSEYALAFKKDTIDGGYYYDECLTDYCPNCGAKMDGDPNEDL